MGDIDHRGMYHEIYLRVTEKKCHPLPKFSPQVAAKPCACHLRVWEWEFAKIELVYYDVVQNPSLEFVAERIEMSTLTVRLTDSEERDLQMACEQTGKSKSEVVRELLADSLRTYRLRQALQASQAELGGAARQAGWLTEDNILSDTS